VLRKRVRHARQLESKVAPGDPTSLSDVVPDIELEVSRDVGVERGHGVSMDEAGRDRGERVGATS
jgi:hypothetical protein